MRENPDRIYLGALLALAAEFVLPFTGGVAAMGTSVVTMALVAGIFAADSRRWVRGLCLAVVFALGFQCLPGGAPHAGLCQGKVGIFSALLAHATLCAVGILAVAASPRFRRGGWDFFCPDPILKHLVLGTTVLVFLELGLGNALEHRLDFLIVFCAVAVCLRAFRVVRLRVVKIWSAAWLAVIAIRLGIAALSLATVPAIASTRLALGSIALLLGVIFSFRLFRAGDARRFWAPEADIARRTA